jgi:type II restriction enzyme
MTQFAANRPVADFYCTRCSEEYELKSQMADFGNKVVDGAASAMRARLAESNAPNFMFLSYDVRQLAVRHLMVVPKHFVRPEVIEERRPLGPMARRAGRVGCNILLKDIPPSGKVFIVRDGRSSTVRPSSHNGSGRFSFATRHPMRRAGSLR